MLRPSVLVEGCQRPGTLLANTSSDAKYDISHWAGWIHLVSEKSSPPEAVPSKSYSSTSPSVYVIYRGVSATGGCSTIGSTYASVTISYSQNELRTFSEGKFGVFNFADLYSNCTTQTAPPVASQPDCTDSPGAHTCLSLLDKVQSDQDNQLKHCYPQLEYPYKVRALEPEWANCESASEDRFYGVYDPPRALVSAESMAPKPTLDSGTRLSAAPGSSILPS